MKHIISLIIFIISASAFSATCTSTSRNNYSTNQILTSSALNADFNQLVTKANAFDGGCITDGSLEDDALNTTDFAPMLKGIKEGCKVTYSSATQVSISKCLAAANGQFVSTTIATTVAFGCSGCSSEVASTLYYVYIQTGSSGTTLTPLILTTAPNEDGYDNSGNKVLARFYNNNASDIDTYSIDQWHVNRFIAQDTGLFSVTLTATALGTIVDATFKARRDGKNMHIIGYLDTGTVAGSTAFLTLPSSFRIDSASVVSTVANSHYAGKGDILPSGSMVAAHHVSLFLDGSSTTDIFFAIAGDAEGYTKGTGSGMFTSGNALTVNFTVPIAGWND